MTNLTRRHFLAQTVTGAAAFAQLSGLPTHPAKAKRIIYLFQSGGPSQLESFDYKPELVKHAGKDLPESVRKGQRLTAMSATQLAFPMVASKFGFQQHGKSGAWVSELFPHTAKVIDDLCIVRSLHTEAINHDPAVTFLQTGSQIAGRPSFGAWISYGLGAETKELPAFCVLISPGQGGSGQPLYDRLWGSGFLPTRYQGIKFRSVGDPVLYLSDPAGYTRDDRRTYLDGLNALNKEQLEATGDPEISTRMAQYEMAFRMQASVPELTDLSKEPESSLSLYGPDVKKPGTFAANCLLARRLAERGVRFIQLYHRDWDHHGGLVAGMPKRALETDQPAAGLLQDLKQRGMLDDTLVVWGGEFGRTVYCQGRLTATEYGRDHHPRCFTVWMAGGGVKPGMVYGETDDFSYNIVKDPVHVHDFQATLLHLLGVDHTKLTYKFQGRHFRLTDVHGHVVKELLA
ncbi:sulfatase [Bryobacterales bacterium F-183]|nr:sulfatase [Bryobacterales bacterium F-183]